MRILVTVPWGERLGGAEAMLHTALGGARQSGHEMELVFFEPGSWPDELTDAGFRIEVIPAGRLRHAHRSVTTVLRLARLLRRRRPDLILNWSAKMQLYGSPAAMLVGLRDRVVWWQQMIPSRGGWLDRCATLLPASAIGCYSSAAAEAQRQLFPARRTFVVAPGAPIPDERAEPQALELPAEIPVVGLVGRLQPWKGQDRLLKAQALLRDRGHDMHLLIVGGDSYGLSPEYAASLSPLASRLGIADAVTMTGQVADAGPYLGRMDILVNASDPEPFGIVLLEGMARGLAVVAVDSGGPREFIDNGRTGLLARSGEPGDLADALEPLLESSTLRREIGQAGRERFMEEFTDSAMQRRFFANLEAIARGTDGDEHPRLDPRADIVA
jgi:glycosyltransferase involved in cell wall biosynthesis